MLDKKVHYKASRQMKKGNYQLWRKWVRIFKHFSQSCESYWVCILYAWNVSTSKMCVLNYEQRLVTWQKSKGQENSQSIYCKLNFNLTCKEFHDKMKINTKVLKKVQCNEKYGWMVQWKNMWRNLLLTWILQLQILIVICQNNNLIFKIITVLFFFHS
jgi:hypothetical protein